MKKYMILIVISFFLINSSFSLPCASELQGKSGTCINQTYKMLYTGTNAYYSCSQIITGLWYYNTCTATVSTTSIVSDNGNIIAEWWSNDTNKVTACINHDGLICNVNPMFNFKTDMSLTYVGYCDSSQQTCVKCSASHTETLKFDGSGAIKTIINSAGNGLCESGCQASVECDEKPIGYNNINEGCTNACQWQSCNNYKWNPVTNLCHASCQTNAECFSPAVCDLAINPNTCIIDPEPPEYHDYFHLDLTPTPDNSLITEDLVNVSAYWTDNLYLSYADLEVMNASGWQLYSRITNINSPSVWTNYSINTSSFSEEFVNWRIRMTDASGKNTTIPEQSFYVYEASNRFNITLNLTYDSQLFFSWGASAGNNVVADNSFDNVLIADIILTHNGHGVNSKFSFKLNESINEHIRIKINNVSNPLTATFLDTNFKYPDWCQSMIYGEKCHIWVWMDLDRDNAPNEYLRQLVINNEQN